MAERSLVTKRRTVLQSALGAAGLASLPTWAQTGFPGLREKELREIAAAVLPESIGRKGTDVVADQLVRWVRDYKPGAAGAQGGVLTRSGLIFIGGGDTSLHAVDQNTGKDLWTFPPGRRSTSTPATWQTKSGRQMIVIATGQGADTSLMAFALPQ